MRGERKKTAAFKKFEAKVDRVLNGDTPTGRYTHTSTLYMPVTTSGYPTVIDKDMGNIDVAIAGTEQYLEFFTPRMFKDAEGILFNNKPATYASWTTTAVASPVVSGTNLSTANVTKVNGSSAMFHFRNQSARPITLEMYILRGKGGGTTPRQDLQDSFSINGTIGIAQARGTAQTEYFSNYGVQINHAPSFPEQWDIERISWEFEPGEEAWHKLKGPFRYKMDGAKKNNSTSLTAPSWSAPDQPGCGLYVMFRVGTDISLVSSSTGTYAAVPQILGVAADRTNRVAVARNANFYSVASGGTGYAGGLCCTIVRHYNIELPEGLVPANPRNAIILFNGYGIPNGATTETQVEEDQPSTLPTNPIT